MFASDVRLAQRAAEHWLAPMKSSPPKSADAGVFLTGAQCGVVSSKTESAAPFSLEPVGPGMSGAIVFQCRTQDGGHHVLKGWPQGTDPTRMAEVHRVMRWARQQGCEFVPELTATAGGATMVDSGGRWWDLADWMPGAALDISASPAEIRSGAAAIRRFHASVAPLGTTNQPAPAVTARLRRLKELDRSVPLAIGHTDVTGRDPELQATVDRAARLLSSHWSAASRQIARTLSAAARTPDETHYVLRDIHREHLLFRQPTGREKFGGEPPPAPGCRVTGMIDFDAIRVDTPAADLARWVSDFLVGRDQRDCEEIWQAAVAGFDQIWPFAIQHQALARQLLVATTWISLANWMVWLNVEKRQFPAGPQAVACRIEQLSKLTCQTLS